MIPLLEGPHVFVFWLVFIGAPLTLLGGSSPNERRIGYALLAAHVISLFIVSRRIGFGRLNEELLGSAGLIASRCFILSLVFAPFCLYIEFWRLAIKALRPSGEKKRVNP